MNRSYDRSGYRGPWVHYPRAFQRDNPEPKLLHEGARGVVGLEYGNTIICWGENLSESS